MGKEDALKEIIYMLTMALARLLFDEGLIVREQYDSFDTDMQRKYAPTYSILFTNLNLL